MKERLEDVVVIAVGVVFGLIIFAALCADFGVPWR